MAKHVVLTGVGQDRVGMVAGLAEVLLELGCNLLDSSMTLLRGQFAIILMIALPDEFSSEELSGKLRAAEQRLGLTFHSRELTDQELDEKGEDGHPYIISVYGADKPGIVAGVTKALSELGANVTDVETKYSGDFRSGRASVYLMVLEISLPDSVSEKKLDSTLKEISTQLSIDVSWQSLNVVQL